MDAKASQMKIHTKVQAASPYPVGNRSMAIPPVRSLRLRAILYVALEKDVRLATLKGSLRTRTRSVRPNLPLQWDWHSSHRLPRS